MDFARYRDAVAEQQWPVEIRELDQWLNNYIFYPPKEFIDIGYMKGVCPLSLTAWRNNSIYLYHLEIEPNNPTKKKENLIDLLKRVGFEFRSHFDENSFFDCLIITINGVDEFEFKDVLESAHRDIRVWALENKLMLGAFHPGNKIIKDRVIGKLDVMRSPIPIFVYRNLLKRDLNFFKGNPTYLSIFTKQFPEV